MQPIYVFDSTAYTVLYKQLSQIKVSLYEQYNKFIDSVNDIIINQEVPLCFRKVCYQVYEDRRLQRVVCHLIKNCPIDEDLPYLEHINPLSDKYKKKRTFVAEAFLQLYAKLTGSPLLGLSDLRLAYKHRILMQNNLLPDLIGLPIITNGITHALNLARELFLDPNDELLIHDMYWENNDLIFKVLGQVNLRKYSMFSANKFNVIGFREMLYEESNTSRPKFVFFNFPNNPTGYTPCYQEMQSIVDVIAGYTEKFRKTVVVIVDEAGYGFFYENVCQESIFSFLVKKNSSYIIPILAKGSTKEDLVYGNRIASLTFGVPSQQSEILEAKVAALVRGYLCSVCKSAQLATLRCIKNTSRLNEFNFIFHTIQLRFQYIKYEIIPRLAKKDFFRYFYLYPCNSGFFLTLKTINTSAFEVRKFLNKQDVAINVLNENHIRICFSSVNFDNLDRLFETLLNSTKLIAEAKV